ncbi:MAG: flagellar protein [Defluviitaleaceae bacterium]|nr:flagellar protein [Defluviitaleaceae bacterium]
MIQNVNLKIGGVHESPTRLQETTANPTASPTVNFRDILKIHESSQPVNFSKHAAVRLSDRNISLTGEQLQRLTDGVGKADEKGIRDSLVLVDDVALVVNIKSRTVITALSQSQESVFSNIDGAVIV